MTPDSVYHSTLFIEPSGRFYFKEGFLDSIDDDGSIFYVQLKKNEGIKEFKKKYKNLNRTDTIRTYFLKDIGRNESLQSENIYDKLIGSYILKKLGELELSNKSGDIIRLVYPSEDLHVTKNYHVITIRFFEDSAKMYYALGRSLDHNGIRLFQKDSTLLKKGDIKLLKKQFSEISESTSVDCTDPGNPWFMEYLINSNYKKFIISNYCVSEGIVQLRPIGLSCFLVRKIAKKMFSIDWTKYNEEYVNELGDF
jgi:hypothetical protein